MASRIASRLNLPQSLTRLDPSDHLIEVPPDATVTQLDALGKLTRLLKPPNVHVRKGYTPPAFRGPYDPSRFSGRWIAHVFLTKVSMVRTGYILSGGL
jgi:hypothetical protein